MGSPDGAIPEMAVTFSQLYEAQDYTQEGIAESRNLEFQAIAEEARLNFLNTILGGFLSVIGGITAAINQFISDLLEGISGATGGLIDLTGWFSDEHDTLLTKPSVTQIPINSPLWRTMAPNEESTFPRSTLTFGSASSTASSSADSSHSHSLNQVPDYQPSGNGTNYAEIGFIRIEKDGNIDATGIITGNSATFAGIGAAYVGLYKQNPTTGLLTLMNSTASTDRKSSMTTQNTEFIFSAGATFPVLQDEIWAVATLQITSLFQTPGSLMRTTQTKMTRSAVNYPRSQYAYAGTYTTLPSTIAESALHYDQSNKVPFYYLRRV